MPDGEDGGSGDLTLRVAGTRTTCAWAVSRLMKSRSVAGGAALGTPDPAHACPAQVAARKSAGSGMESRSPLKPWVECCGREAMPSTQVRTSSGVAAGLADR